MSPALLAQYEPKPEAALDHERQLCEARYSPCGKLLAGAGYDGAIARWDVSDGQSKKLPPLVGHHGWVQCLAFDPQGQWLFSADSWGELRCWGAAGESPAPRWTRPQALAGWIRAIAVSPDGRQIAAAGNDPVVRIWSCEDGSLQQELAGHPDDVFSVRFHPGGQALATGDLKGVIRHWDLASGQPMRRLDASLLYKLNSLQDCGGIRALAFDGSGEVLACGGQKNPAGGFAQGTPCVLLFDWASGELRQELAVGGADDGFVYDLAFHPDGFLMGASCAMPGKGHLFFWKPGEAKEFFLSNKLPNGRSVSLHPDRRRLAVVQAISPNGNGRSLKDGEYPGGSAKIHLLGFAGAG